MRKKKVCRFCVDKADFIDYKKAEILAPFIQERGKILPRRMTGNLFAASAVADRGDQAGAEYRVAAVRGGTVVREELDGRRFVAGVVVTGRRTKMPARRRRYV